MANKLWDPKREAFREAIKEVREKAGLKQAELATVLDKPQSYISKYENGERRLDYVELIEILDACDWTIGRFNKLFVSKTTML